MDPTLPLLLLFYIVPISSQDIRCNNPIRFHVNSTSEGLQRVTYASVDAAKLQDCINKCYSYTFCYSAIYYPAEEQCKFSYLSAYNCSTRELLTEYSDSLETPVALECIKCDKAHYVAAAPPVRRVTNTPSSTTILSPLWYEKLAADINSLEGAYVFLPRNLVNENVSVLKHDDALVEGSEMEQEVIVSSLNLPKTRFLTGIINESTPSTATTEKQTTETTETLTTTTKQAVTSTITKEPTTVTTSTVAPTTTGTQITTTTEAYTTTDASSTTQASTTTEEPSTTEASTTEAPTTTEATTAKASTTTEATTTAKVSTTPEVTTTTQAAFITEALSTETPATRETPETSPTTTEVPTTTQPPTTTKLPTTTPPPTTTEPPTTTKDPRTTDLPSTTELVSSTPTQTIAPNTTQIITTSVTESSAPPNKTNPVESTTSSTTLSPNEGAKCFLCSSFGVLDSKCEPKRTCEGTYCRVQMTQNEDVGMQVLLQACEYGTPPVNDGCTRTRHANETTITCVCLGSFCNTEILAILNANLESPDTKNLLKITKETGDTPASALTQDLSILADPEKMKKLPEGACKSRLSFEVVNFELGSKSMASVEMHIPVHSAEDCAQQCYARNCTTTGYVPTVVAQTDQCLLSFKSDETCAEDLERVDAVNITGAIELRCLQCDDDIQVEDKFDSKTTISEDGHGVLERQQACRGELRFDYEALGSEVKAKFVVHSHSAVKSAAECARLCYERNCDSAGFVPESMQCLLSVQINENDSSCSGKSMHSSVPLQSGPVQMTCVTCFEKDIEDGAASSPSKKVKTSPKEILPPIIVGDEIPICSNEIVFQEIRADVGDKSLNTISSHENAESAAECAKLCFERKCHDAGYVPQSKACLFLEESEQSSNKCNYLRGWKSDSDAIAPIRLRCVRCGISDEDSEDLETDDESEGSQLIQSGPILNDQEQFQQYITGTEFGKSCIVTFQVGVDRDTSNYRFTNSTTVTNPMQCAQICYRDGCTMAEYLPAGDGSKLCYLYFGGKEECAAGLEEHYLYRKSSAPLTLQCFRCTDHRNLPLTRPHYPTTTPLPKLPERYIQNSIDSESELEGCVITFFVVDANVPLDRAIHYNNRVLAESTSHCASICYAKHCKRASYDPRSRSCLMSFSEEQCLMDDNTLSSTRVPVYIGKERVRIECLRCDEDHRLKNIPGVYFEPRKAVRSPLKKLKKTVDPKIGLRIDSNQWKEEVDIQANSDCLVSFEVAEPNVHVSWRHINTSREVNSSVCANKCYHSGCVLAGWDPRDNYCLFYFGGLPRCAGIKRHLQVNPNTPVWVQCLSCDSVFVQGRGVDVATTTVQATQQIYTPEPARVCTGLLSYELEANMDGPVQGLVFENKVSAGNAHKCALICYETRCKVAEFIPDSNQCRLSYGDPVCLEDSQRYTGYSGNKAVRIQCVICGSGRLTGDPKANQVIGVSQSIDSKPLVQEVRKEEHTKITIENKELNMVGVDLILQGVGPGQLCGGRLLFQILDVASLGRLNISNDVSATSPADCARKCWREGCSMAGYIPNPARSGGVCLLTRENGFCLPSRPLVAQHLATTPFVIGCIRCSACDYSLREAIPLKDFPLANVQEDASSIGECAAKCHKHSCRAAAFSARSSAGNCLLATENHSEDCSRNGLDEAPLDTLGQLPVILDCVRCIEPV